MTKEKEALSVAGTILLLESPCSFVRYRKISSRPEGPKAGPKGRKLEVRARRAPRLLVVLYGVTVTNWPSEGSCHVPIVPCASLAILAK